MLGQLSLCQYPNLGNVNQWSLARLAGGIYNGQRIKSFFLSNF